MLRLHFIATLLTLLPLTASAADLDITAASLDRLAACQKAEHVASPLARGQLETDAARQARRAAVRTEAFARSCGFDSLKQLVRLELRVLVATVEAKDEEVVRTYPEDALEQLQREREADWKAEAERGEATAEEIAQRREVFASVTRTVAAARVRLRKRNEVPATHLDVSALAPEGGEANDATLRAAAGQRPLSGQERAALAAWRGKPKPK